MPLRLRKRHAVDQVRSADDQTKNTRNPSLEIDHQLVLGRLLDRKVAGLGAFENPVDGAEGRVGA
jgi:hypothetical protein